MADTGKCRTCGAALVWAKTPEGKTIPLNARRVRGYSIDAEGMAQPSPETYYVSHFTTCPQAAEHSKRKQP